VNFVADESVDGPIVRRLRQDGHHVWYVAELSPGIRDDEVLERANQEGCLLLTSDSDFGELVFRQHRLSHGIVLVRLEGLPTLSKSEIVSAVIAKHGSELLMAFTVIRPGQTRIRRRGN
jgi:predicted nuclease of predicted toxin-antitoxin system